jgi:glutaredoxin
VRRIRVIGCMWLVVCLTVSCHRSEEDASQQATDLTPAPNQLPPLELRDETRNLLLTWVDEKGDFRVVQRIDEVPAERREQVRVVVTDQIAGTGTLVYVADLRKKQPNGTYPVRTLTRAQWDEVGASRRQARIEALAPSARPPTPAPSASSTTGQTTRVVAIVYGASWCRPCHDAARYLKGLGVTVVQKDVDSDQLAQGEMQEKLRRAGYPPTASIPVIDVGGRLLVGYSPDALGQAVAAARSARPL